MLESIAIFCVGAAGQVYNQTNEFVYLGGNGNHSVRNAWCSFRKYTLERYNRLSASFELKTRMLRAEELETMPQVCVA